MKKSLWMILVFIVESCLFNVQARNLSDVLSAGLDNSTVRQRKNFRRRMNLPTESIKTREEYTEFSGDIKIAVCDAEIINNKVCPCNIETRRNAVERLTTNKDYWTVIIGILTYRHPQVRNLLPFERNFTYDGMDDSRLLANGQIIYLAASKITTCTYEDWKRFLSGMEGQIFTCDDKLNSVLVASWLRIAYTALASNSDESFKRFVKSKSERILGFYNQLGASKTTEVESSYQAYITLLVADTPKNPTNENIPLIQNKRNQVFQPNELPPLSEMITRPLLEVVQEFVRRAVNRGASVEDLNVVKSRFNEPSTNVVDLVEGAILLGKPYLKVVNDSGLSKAIPFYEFYDLTTNAIKQVETVSLSEWNLEKWLNLIREQIREDRNKNNYNLTILHQNLMRRLAMLCCEDDEVLDRSMVKGKGSQREMLTDKDLEKVIQEAIENEKETVELLAKMDSSSIYDQRREEKKPNNFWTLYSTACENCEKDMKPRDYIASFYSQNANVQKVMDMIVKCDYVRSYGNINLEIVENCVNRMTVEELREALNRHSEVWFKKDINVRGDILYYIMKSLVSNVDDPTQFYSLSKNENSFEGFDQQLIGGLVLEHLQKLLSGSSDEEYCQHAFAGQAFVSENLVCSKAAFQNISYISNLVERVDGFKGSAFLMEVFNNFGNNRVDGDAYKLGCHALDRATDESVLVKYVWNPPVQYKNDKGAEIMHRLTKEEYIVEALLSAREKDGRFKDLFLSRYDKTAFERDPNTWWYGDLKQEDVARVLAQITKEELLEKLALKGPTYRLQKGAIEKLNNEDLLLKIAMGVEPIEDCVNYDQTNDGFAHHQKFGKVVSRIGLQKVAIQRLTNPLELADILMQSEWRDVQEEAHKRLIELGFWPKSSVAGRVPDESDPEFKEYDEIGAMYDRAINNLSKHDKERLKRYLTNKETLEDKLETQAEQLQNKIQQLSR